MHGLFMYMIISFIIYLSPMLISDGRAFYKEAINTTNQKFVLLNFFISGLLVGWFIGFMVWLLLFLRRD